MLEKWSDEVKEAVMEYRACNHTLKDTYDWVWLNYPDAEKYAMDTFQKWCRSDEGKRLRKRGQSVVKEEASAGVAEKDNRILAVMEVTTKIMGALRELPAEDKAFVPLNRELRENLKYIAEETGDRMTDTVKDAFQAFKSNIESHDEWKRIAQQQGLIPQTPSN